MDKNRGGGMEIAASVLTVTTEEEATYRAIAEGQPVDAPEAVAHLVSIGLVTQVGDEYVAVDPRVVAQQHLASHHAALAATLQQMGQVSNLETLARHYDPGRYYGGPVSERVQSRHLINQRIAHVLADTHDGLLTAQPGVPSDRSPAALQDGIRRARALLERGVPVRSLYPSAALTHPPTAEYATFVLEHGGEVRVGQDLPPRMVLAGRDLFVKNHVPESDDAAGWHIQDVAATAFARDVFESYWSRATPWQEAQAALDDAVSTPVQRMILRGLAKGDTQSAVATQLGVSGREVGRELEALRDTLGMRSTNQLMVWWATSEDKNVA
ncbi:hypothetical protein [Streptomyces sp. NPDC094032]|uniref:helix-turn-helix transcriptional regulator n=1 Tax=Streptomyces sp. NPDC094032 TaxID=3155308 RepID=UPI003325E4DD